MLNWLLIGFIGAVVMFLLVLGLEWLSVLVSWVIRKIKGE